MDIQAIRLFFVGEAYGEYRLGQEGVFLSQGAGSGGVVISVETNAKGEIRHIVVA